MNEQEKAAYILGIKTAMEKMTAQERLDLLAEIAGNYCQKCGYDNGGMYCHCDNDE